MIPPALKSDLILSPYARLNNLYKVIDKNGQIRTFKFNWVQQKLYDEMWYCNVVLKARQLGLSTLICNLFLDACLFNSNTSAGIICHTREDSEQLFKKIKFAYDYLAPEIKNERPAKNDSARELIFANGSSIRVGTSMRGSTLNYLLISEFGKICARYRDKAEEIITGSLNTIAPGQFIFIESTAEGREGYFYDMCKKAEEDKKIGKELSKLDFRFHFFPWYEEPTYRIGSIVPHSEDNLRYFESLKVRGIELDIEQRNWYANKSVTQKENMLREYPATPEEAWESAKEGAYYDKYISQARVEKRICRVPYDHSLPVHTAWDLGYNDSNAIWYFQVYGNGKEIRLIDYDEGSGESLMHWIKIVKEKPYIYEMHLAPHDILAHEYSSGVSRQVSARKMGISLVAVPRAEINPGIDAVRNMLNRCWFDEKKCARGIKCLENYRKEWDERFACWKMKPRHDEYSHGADAFRTLAVGLSMVTSDKRADGRSLSNKIDHYFPSVR